MAQRPFVVKCHHGLWPGGLPYDWTDAGACFVHSSAQLKAHCQEGASFTSHARMNIEPACRQTSEHAHQHSNCHATNLHHDERQARTHTHTHTHTHNTHRCTHMQWATALSEWGAPKLGSVETVKAAVRPLLQKREPSCTGFFKPWCRCRHTRRVSVPPIGRTPRHVRRLRLDAEPARRQATSAARIPPFILQRCLTDPRLPATPPQPQELTSRL